MASTVCHIEYKSDDLSVSQKFCEAAFGWEFRAFGDAMVVFSADGGHIGGFVKGERPNGKASPEVCYKVESLDSFLEHVKSLGASDGNAKHPVPGVGWYASVVAPDGNEFGVVEFTEQG
jgi:predicted enzyme related to lactoylglutathione lyase